MPFEIITSVGSPFLFRTPAPGLASYLMLLFIVVVTLPVVLVPAGMMLFRPEQVSREGPGGWICLGLVVPAGLLAPWLAALVILRRTTLEMTAEALVLTHASPLGRTRHHWHPAAVDSFDVRVLRHRRSISYHLQMQLVGRKAWAFLFSHSDEGLVRRLARTLGERLRGCQAAAAALDVGSTVPPGFLHEPLPDGLRLACPAPGWTRYLIVPLVAAVILLAWVPLTLAQAASPTHLPAPSAAEKRFLLAGMALSGAAGLTLLVLCLRASITRATFLLRDGSLEVETRSWLGRRRRRWSTSELEEVALACSGDVGASPAWQTLGGGVPTLVLRPRGQRRRKLLTFHAPPHILWVSLALRQGAPLSPC